MKAGPDAYLGGVVRPVAERGGVIIRSRDGVGDGNGPAAPLPARVRGFATGRFRRWGKPGVSLPIPTNHHGPVMEFGRTPVCQLLAPPGQCHPGVRTAEI